MVPVEIDGSVHQVFVLKRPHVDAFLQRMGELYECVLFTASLAKYADPVADLLDRWGVFRARWVAKYNFCGIFLSWFYIIFKMCNAVQ